MNKPIKEGTTLSQGSKVLRKRTELHNFSRSDLEEMAKQFAKLSIVGRMFVGKIGEASAHWLEDGSIEVRTPVEGEY